MRPKFPTTWGTVSQGPQVVHPTVFLSLPSYFPLEGLSRKVRVFRSGYRKSIRDRVVIKGVGGWVKGWHYRGSRSMDSSPFPYGLRSNRRCIRSPIGHRNDRSRLDALSDRKWSYYIMTFLPLISVTGSSGTDPLQSLSSLFIGSFLLRSNMRSLTFGFSGVGVPGF